MKKWVILFLCMATGKLYGADGQVETLTVLKTMNIDNAQLNVSSIAQVHGIHFQKANTTQTVAFEGYTATKTWTGGNEFSSITLPSNAVLPEDLNAVDSPANAEVPEYQSSTGRFRWVAQTGSGGGGSGYTSYVDNQDGVAISSRNILSEDFTRTTSGSSETIVLASRVAKRDSSSTWTAWQIYQSSITISSDTLTIGGIAYKFPPNDGSADQRLTTNGSGVLTWETVAGGGLPLPPGATNYAQRVATGSLVDLAGSTISATAVTATSGTFSDLFNKGGRVAVESAVAVSTAISISRLNAVSESTTDFNVMISTKFFEFFIPALAFDDDPDQPIQSGGALTMKLGSYLTSVLVFSSSTLGIAQTNFGLGTGWNGGTISFRTVFTATNTSVDVSTRVTFGYQVYCSTDRLSLINPVYSATVTVNTIIYQTTMSHTSASTGTLVGGGYPGVCNCSLLFFRLPLNAWDNANSGVIPEGVWVGFTTRRKDDTF